MTARDFCYWMQGYFEILGDKKDDLTLDHRQVLVIANHLNMVFKHEIDPSHGDEKHQKELSDIHAGLVEGLSSRPMTNC